MKKKLLTLMASEITIQLKMEISLNEACISAYRSSMEVPEDSSKKKINSTVVGASNAKRLNADELQESSHLYSWRPTVEAVLRPWQNTSLPWLRPKIRRLSSSSFLTTSCTVYLGMNMEGGDPDAEERDEEVTYSTVLRIPSSGIAPGWNIQV